MKSKFILIIPLLFAIASCDSGANNNDYCIKATEDLNNYEINTKLQNDFLNLTDASLMDENICGLKELSKPNKVHLSWESNKNDISYRVIVSEKEDLSSPMVFKTNDNYLDISNLKVDTTYYYVIRSQDDASFATKVLSFHTSKGVRNLDIDGVTNVRDLGGWSCEDGKTIKQGLIFRGGRLNNSYPEGSGNNGTSYSKKDTTARCYEREITSIGIESFQELGIINEIDLRKEDGNGFPGDKNTEKTFDNVAGVKYNAFPMGKSDPLADSLNISSLKGIFEFLSKKENYPVYYHCNIGTNRTGTISMLLEGLCGVSYEDMLKDYMFSNFGTICVWYRQYDEQDEPRAETTDVTVNNEVYDRIYKAEGDSISKKTISVLKQAGISEETALAVKNILLGNN